MGEITIIIVAGLLFAALVGFFMLKGNRSSGKMLANSGLRNLFSSQRGGPGGVEAGGSPRKTMSSALEALSGTGKRRSDSRLTLTKRLKYAQWAIPSIAFRALEVGLSLVAFSLVSLKMNALMSCLALLTGPIFMRWLLAMMMMRRFRRFDADYPQFLMSLVGLLKTGMTPIGAIETAALGLEPTSLVKEECELMVERLRFGVSEDKSIGSFGEDIYHPEIELFVQALLLSRRVGGTLSETLERLAKQVRKRQYFRNSAVAAVGMQRGSIWAIIGLLFGLELYLYLSYPSLVVEAMKSDAGWQVWQFGLCAILLGIFWVRQITNIRV